MALPVCVVGLVVGTEEMSMSAEAIRVGLIGLGAIGAAVDAAFILKNAGKVFIVPGYGLSVAQAQQAVREMAVILK